MSHWGATLCFGGFACAHDCARDIAEVRTAILAAHVRRRQNAAECLRENRQLQP